MRRLRDLRQLVIARCKDCKREQPPNEAMEQQQHASHPALGALGSPSLDHLKVWHFNAAWISLWQSAWCGHSSQPAWTTSRAGTSVQHGSHIASRLAELTAQSLDRLQVWNSAQPEAECLGHPQLRVWNLIAAWLTQCQQALRAHNSMHGPSRFAAHYCSAARLSLRQSA